MTKRAIVNGVPITLALLVCVVVTTYLGLADTVVGRLIGWLFAWPVRPFIRFIPRFDDPPLIGIGVTLIANLFVYSVICYLALRLMGRFRRGA